MRQGCEVCALVDAVGGTSILAHDTAVRRIGQAGAKMLGVTHILSGSCFCQERAVAVPCGRML
jgi:hypothetical protein